MKPGPTFYNVDYPIPADMLLDACPCLSPYALLLGKIIIIEIHSHTQAALLPTM